MGPDEGRRDRARGAVLGSAVGDALGAAYEFGTRALGDGPPQMLGGGLGGFAPGEWTDDTTMAWAVLDAAATYGDLRGEPALDSVARRFRAWYDSGPADIGNQTRQVLRLVGPAPTGAALAATSHDLHERTGHTAGNGSLMRTGPVALAHLDDADAAAGAARLVGDLTHHDERAVDACVLWTLAVRHAVVHGQLDVRVGLASLDAESAAQWRTWLDEAESREPASFSPNGFVVTALQAAWSAIVHTPVPDDDPPRHLADALESAIRVGDDTDTVAAIAGALLGARWGLSAIPTEWLEALHGYPGLRAADLVALVDNVVTHA